MKFWEFRKMFQVKCRRLKMSHCLRYRVKKSENFNLSKKYFPRKDNTSFLLRLYLHKIVFSSRSQLTVGQIKITIIIALDNNHVLFIVITAVDRCNCKLLFCYYSLCSLSPINTQRQLEILLVYRAF